MDIAQAVLEKMEKKLDDKMNEFMLRGDRFLREMQTRQEQLAEALCRSMGVCMESQRAFHEEHKQLIAAVRALTNAAAHLSPLGAQVSEAAAAATTTEALRSQ